MSLRVHVAPRGTRDFLREAVKHGGGVVVDDVGVADAVVWTSPRDPDGLRALLARRPDLPWVQLPWAGIEHYLDVLDDRRVWTAAQGIYADDVAEHVLALTLAGLRDLKKRALASSWQVPSGLSLRGANVTVFGAGGITRALGPLLAPFAVRLTVVRRRAEAFDGAVRTLTLDERVAAVADADVVVVALALTPQTRGIIGAQELAAMKSTAWLVNVARGGHVDTAALVDALARGAIGGAGLDVTDPEPLPEGHPLWSAPRCLITPHCANTPEMAVPVLTERVRENVRRRIAGLPLLGVVDVDAGY
jgi:phosphoglycerate dehydrogenase-like enzyme